MMVDLGRYAVEVLLAYAVTLGLLAWIVFVSVLRSRKIRKLLEEAEGRND